VGQVARQALALGPSSFIAKINIKSAYRLVSVAPANHHYLGMKSHDVKHHLSWGDVAIDYVENPQSLKVHLKKFKTDQLGKGVDVFIRKTD